eukprot:gene26026-34628_t
MSKHVWSLNNNGMQSMPISAVEYYQEVLRMWSAWGVVSTRVRELFPHENVVSFDCSPACVLNDTASTSAVTDSREYNLLRCISEQCSTFLSSVDSAGSDQKRSDHTVYIYNAGILLDGNSMPNMILSFYVNSLLPMVIGVGALLSAIGDGERQMIHSKIIDDLDRIETLSALCDYMIHLIDTFDNSMEYAYGPTPMYSLSKLMMNKAADTQEIAFIDLEKLLIAFIRQALYDSGLRLDGRGVDDYRDTSIELSRTETSCTSEVHIGSTFVVAVVSSEIVPPYPDKPVEGILQFSADISPTTEARGGVSHTDIVRYLERSIRDSDAIDTESLCIISGLKVWQITCDVKVIDASGGNIIDACMLACVSALKGYRKPETSAISSNPSSSTTSSISKGRNSSATKIVVHSSNEREPLPLAFQHTPLTVSIGLFKYAPAKVGNTEELRVIMIADPSPSEDLAMDGKILFSINAHRELVAMNKPGGVGLTIETIMKATEIASKHAHSLHEILNQALLQLDEQVLKERDVQMEVMRKYQQLIRSAKTKNNNNNSSSGGNVEDEMYVDDVDDLNNGSFETAGVDRNDPILMWENLHSAVAMK